jgi:hypothetical protein
MARELLAQLSLDEKIGMMSGDATYLMRPVRRRVRRLRRKRSAATDADVQRP